MLGQGVWNDQQSGGWTDGGLQCGDLGWAACSDWEPNWAWTTESQGALDLGVRDLVWRPGSNMSSLWVPCEHLSGLQFFSSGKWEEWCLLPSPHRADGKISSCPHAHPHTLQSLSHPFLPCSVPWEAQQTAVSGCPQAGRGTSSRWKRPCFDSANAVFPCSHSF